MLDELIEREDVSKVIVDICNSARYYNKTINNSVDHQIYSDSDQILFLFYDALYKYKVIIGDMEYFSDFLIQVDKLIRKLDNYYDICYGINRIIGKVCAFKLGIDDIDDNESKESILKYIYKKYILNGYYIHGYSSHYHSQLINDGIKIEEYNNLYDEFIMIQDILRKKDYLNILDKDFSVKEISFTESMLMGCYYSVNAPMFFSKFLCHNDFISKNVDAYAKNNYDLCYKNLQKLCYKLDLSDMERNKFISTFKKQWKQLDKSNSNISLVLVPRKLIDDKIFDIDDFISDNKDLDFNDIVYKLLSSKNSVSCIKNINKEDIILINLYGVNKYIKEEKKESLVTEIERTFIRNDDEFAFSNVYGKVSVLLLLGMLFIMAGVIVTIITFS